MSSGKAEAASPRANERARKPQPGLSLLRLAQEKVDDAAASIRNVLVDTRAGNPRKNPCCRLDSVDGRRPRAGALPPQNYPRSRARWMPLSFSRRPRMPPQGPPDGRRCGRRVQVALPGAGGLADLEMPHEEANTCVFLAAVCDGAMIMRAARSSSTMRDSFSSNAMPSRPGANNTASRSPARRFASLASAVGRSCDHRRSAMCVPQFRRDGLRSTAETPWIWVCSKMEARLRSHGLLRALGRCGFELLSPVSGNPNRIIR